MLCKILGVLLISSALTASTNGQSSSYNNWSGWTPCSGGQQSRSRTQTETRTCSTNTGTGTGTGSIPPPAKCFGIKTIVPYGFLLEFGSGFGMELYFWFYSGLGLFCKCLLTVYL